MSPASQTGVVLVVEDPIIQTYVRSVLARHGLAVLESDVTHGVSVLRSGETKVDLLITNEPKEFVQFAGRVPVVYVASTPDPGVASRFPRCRVLRKPFRGEQLLRMIGELAGTAA